MTVLQQSPVAHAVADATAEGDALQQHFQPGISADDIEQVFLLKRAQAILQAFSALFHGGAEHVMLRLTVLRELAAYTDRSEERRVGKEC